MKNGTFNNSFKRTAISQGALKKKNRDSIPSSISIHTIPLFLRSFHEYRPSNTLYSESFYFSLHQIQSITVTIIPKTVITIFQIFRQYSKGHLNYNTNSCILQRFILILSNFFQNIGHTAVMVMAMLALQTNLYFELKLIIILYISCIKYARNGFVNVSD